MRYLTILCLFTSLQLFAQSDTISRDDVCAEVFEFEDLYSGTNTRSSPRKDAVSFSEVSFIKDGYSARYISLNTTTSSLNASGQRGVTILLGNNETLDYPNARNTIIVGNYSLHALYSMIRISPEAIGKIKSFGIKGFRLYNEDETVSEDDSSRYRKLLTCLFP